MDTDIDNARKDALSFLRHHKTGVLATIAPSGEPHASMVYYTADDDFNVYILTLIDSRKFAAIQANPKAAFTVSMPDVPQTLQIEGVAMDISLDEEAKEKMGGLVDVLNSNNWFYGPIIKLDPKERVIIWLKPSWVRWADYAFQQSGSEHVLKEIPVIRS
ncbi:MAG TPA: pyridoxamine 5'-phosphate oxidase family protein [Candidatus Paceibacterota bacterium]